MVPSSAFWQAGSPAIAQGKTSAPFTHSLSPIDRSSSGPKETVTKEVNTRIRNEGKEEDDNKKGTNHIEDQEVPKGRTGELHYLEEEYVEVGQVAEGRPDKDKVDEEALGDHDVPPAPEAGL